LVLQQLQRQRELEEPQSTDSPETVIKKFFLSLDVDGDGTLDRGEVLTMLQELWSRTGKMPSNNELRQKRVDDTLDAFDLDQSGSLNLAEFSAMIATDKSYWPLLPQQQRELLRNSTRVSPTKHEERQSLLWDTMQEPRGEAIFVIARECFKASDATGRGELDEEESMVAMAQLWKKIGQPVSGVERLQLGEGVRALLNRKRATGCCTLKFLEWVKLLVMRPFKELLPNDIKQQIPFLVMQEMHSAKAETDTEQQPVSDASCEGPGQLQTDHAQDQGRAMIAAAQALFEAADKDGSGEIEEEELAQLMQKMWQKLGRPMTGVRHRLVEEVREHMRAFDKDGSGGLSFHEFLRMLTRRPWKDLLPIEVQEHLPLLVQGVISPQKPKKSAVDTSSLPVIVILSSAKEIFEETDKNCSGKVEEEELVEMCHRVWHKLDRTVTPALKDDVHDAMLVFNKDGSGGIDFVEFIRLIARRPWKVLLRPEAQEALKHVQIHEIQNEARTNIVKGT